jgi:hypothetical protein
MSMSRQSLVLLGVLVLGGCTGTVDPSSTPAESSRRPEATALESTVPDGKRGPELARAAQSSAPKAHRAPLTVSVAGPSRCAAGDELELIITLERTVVAPIELFVTLPKGAELVRGKLSEALPEGAESVERRLLIRLPEGVPSDDVEVTAHLQVRGAGAHGRAFYRFGRAEPKLPSPRRAGPSVVVGGKNLGPAIPLDR